MEDEKPFPFDAFAGSHLNGPVIVSVLSSCSTLSAPFHIPYFSLPDCAARVASLFPCQTFLNSVEPAPSFS